MPENRSGSRVAELSARLAHEIRNSLGNPSKVQFRFWADLIFPKMRVTSSGTWLLVK
jgi:hypothetical protein